MAIIADTWIHDSIHLVVVRPATRAVTVELFPALDMATFAMSDVRHGAALEVLGLWHGDGCKGMKVLNSGNAKSVSAR